MRKRTFKHGFWMVAVAATALLAACRGDQTAAMMDPEHEEPSTVSLSPHRAAIRTADATSDMPGTFHALDASLLAPDAVIERRHFEVYNRYQMFFDGSADTGQVLANDAEDGLRPAVVTFSAGDVDQFPACSLRVLRHFD